MSYLVLARKWRPQTFDAITGQEHVTQTLRNAIEQDRVHHAFLFCGARGVGKTSAARVFARALNCQAAERATTEPCGECTACVEIAAGGAVDVLEIDGASNRGIGEIRELREGVAYAPQRDRYKIYIIDEVHMLTTEAFNALLKTLEEPPSHVKFIFATTEPQKIPVTILSRCQRFDFKRIPLGVMVERVGEILAAEGVTIAERGLRLVARESEGSMRDALSLLDRIISFCGNEATGEQVAEVLGAADRRWLHGLVEGVLTHDPARALAVVEQVFQFGTDLKQFTTDLVHFLRDLIVIKVAGPESPLTDLADDEVAQLLALGADRSVADLERLFNLAARTAEVIAQVGFPRLELEMAVIRMSQLRPLQPLDRLISRLAALERHLESGAPLPPLQAPSAIRHDGGAQPVAAPAPTHVAPEPTVAPAPEPVAKPEPEPEPEPAPEPEPEPEPEPAPEPVVAAPAPQPEPEPVAPTRPSDLPAPAPLSADDWEAFVEAIRPDHARLAGSLDHAVPLGMREDGTLRLAFETGSYNASRALEHLDAVRRLLDASMLRVRGVAIEEVATVDDSPFRRRQHRTDEILAQRRQVVTNHPVVNAVIERFGGELAHVKVYEGGQA